MGRAGVSTFHTSDILFVLRIYVKIEQNKDNS
jgi:hypothetical protein